MKKQYKLAIFDLDGTVLDTLDDLVDSVNAVLMKHAYPTHTRAEICSYVGNGIALLIARAVPKGTSKQDELAVLADFKDYYKTHCAEKTAPYKGIPEMLARLRAAGVQTAVLSNKADFATQALCKQYFAGLFDAVAGEREAEGIPKKPAPDAVFALMKQLGAVACETVYIGDSEVDVQTAVNAGVDAILVSWGFRTAEALRAAGACVVLDTPEAVFGAITGI